MYFSYLVFHALFLLQTAYADDTEHDLFTWLHTFQHNPPDELNNPPDERENQGIVIPFGVDGVNSSFLLTPENLVELYNNSVLHALDQLCIDANIPTDHCLLDVIQHVKKSFANAPDQTWLIDRMNKEIDSHNQGIEIPFGVDGVNSSFLLTPENLVKLYNNSVVRALDQLCIDAKILTDHCLLDVIQHVQDSFSTAPEQRWLINRMNEELDLPKAQVDRFATSITNGTHKGNHKRRKHHVDYTLNDARHNLNTTVSKLNQLFPEDGLTEGHLLHANTPPGRIECLSLAASLVNAKSYLEIGFNRGHGTAALLTAVPSITDVLEFDTCGNFTASALALTFLKSTFLHARVRLICGNSRDTVPQFGKVGTLTDPLGNVKQGNDGLSFGALPLWHSPMTFDVIHIDGYHSFDMTLTDLNNCHRFAHRNTIVVIEDAGPVGTEEGGWVSVQVNLAVAYAVSSGLVEFVSPGLCQHGQVFLRYL